MGLVNGKVTLQNDYDNWKKIFLNEQIILKKLFNNLAITIEHVGSTAIEGLLAKPIVDILVGVNNLDDVNLLINQLKEYYTVKVNKNINEILLVKENEKETTSLIHVLEINSERYKNMLLFRDILTNNPTIKIEYEKLKIELKEKYHNNREMYTKAKHDFIVKVIENKH